MSNRLGLWPVFAVAAGVSGLIALIIVASWPWTRTEPREDATPGRTGSSERAADVRGPHAGRPHAGRPATPPVPGRDQPFALPDPEPPPELEKLRAEAFSKAMREAARRPADQALREAAGAFVEHNRALAEAHAERQGLSLDEVEELTYFGFFVQHSQRWEEVEELLDRPVDAAMRAQAEDLMHEANQEFKVAIRGLVERAAPESERWQLIRDTQARYKARYFELTGMNEALTEDLLAGDLLRKYPRSQLPPPEQLMPQAEPGAEVTASPDPPARPKEPPHSSPDTE